VLAWDEALYLACGRFTSTPPPETAKETAPTMEKTSYMAHPQGHPPHAYRNKVGPRLAVGLTQEVEQPRAAML
jgi:hypothetical protein